MSHPHEHDKEHDKVQETPAGTNMAAQTPNPANATQGTDLTQQEQQILADIQKASAAAKEEALGSAPSAPKPAVTDSTETHSTHVTHEEEAE